jgi:hypothetical protein
MVRPDGREVWKVERPGALVKWILHFVATLIIVGNFKAANVSMDMASSRS